MPQVRSYKDKQKAKNKKTQWKPAMNVGILWGHRKYVSWRHWWCACHNNLQKLIYHWWWSQGSRYDCIRLRKCCHWQHCRKVERRCVCEPGNLESPPWTTLMTLNMMTLNMLLESYQAWFLSALKKKKDKKRWKCPFDNLLLNQIVWTFELEIRNTERYVLFWYNVE